MTLLGGIMDANVPAEAMHPREKDLSYLRAFISGSAILPKTAAPASEEPQMAPNMALAQHVATPSEPGTFRDQMEIVS